MSEVKAWALIPAAGSGRRMHSAQPKQYALLQGKPVLWHTLHQLQLTRLFSGMVVVLAEGDTQGQAIAAEFPHTQIAIGGEIRLKSVLSGVYALDAADQDWVFVHDAVRPCIRVQDVLALHREIQTDPVGGILGCPVRDTLKKVDLEGRIIQTVDRSTLWQAMTPQAFRYHLLRDQLSTYLTQHPHIDERKGIEECAVMEAAGFYPRMVRGNTDNIKITYPEDLISAESLLSEAVCA